MSFGASFLAKRALPSKCQMTPSPPLAEFSSSSGKCYINMAEKCSGIVRERNGSALSCSIVKVYNPNTLLGIPVPNLWSHLVKPKNYMVTWLKFKSCQKKKYSQERSMSHSPKSSSFLGCKCRSTEQKIPTLLWNENKPDMLKAQRFVAITHWGKVPG